MRKFKYLILLSFLAAAFLFYIGCGSTSPVPPAPINIPITAEFTVTGGGNTIFTGGRFCLSDSKEWKDNIGRIKSAKFKEASYWTLNNSPDLKGYLIYALKSETSDNKITALSDSSFIAADHISNPYKITLTSDQINAFNSELSQNITNAKCYSTEISVSNIIGDKNSSDEYALEGKVTIIIEAELK